MKKTLFLLFFICLFFLPAHAAYTVDSVEVGAQVAENGRTQVTTRIQLTFDAATRQVAIPLPDTEVSHIEVADRKFQKESTDEGISLILESKEGFSGTQTFLVSYQTAFSDDRDDEADTLTMGFLSSRWAGDVGEFTFSINLPKGVETTPEITSGYHGALSTADTSLQQTETTISGVIQNIMAYDSLSMTLVLPDGYFTVRSASLPVVSLSYLSAAMALILLLCMVYWRLKLRSPRFDTSTRLLSPEGLLACQLPMVLDGSSCDTAAMILEWAGLGYLTISLSKSGTVVLTQRMAMGSERSRAEQQLFSRIFRTRRRVAATPGRFAGASQWFQRATRKALYRMILDRKGGNPVFVQLPCRLLLAIGIGALAWRLLPEGMSFRLLAILLGIVGFYYSILLHQALGQAVAMRRLSLKVVVLCVIALLLPPLGLLYGALPETFFGVFACCFSGIATARGPRRNARGVEATAQTLGLAHYYRTVSWGRLQRHQEKNPRFFQNQLPKAVALGADRTFARRFERLSVSMPEWLNLPDSALHSAEALQKQLQPIVKQLRRCFR